MQLEGSLPFTTALSWARCFQSKPSHSISLRSISVFLNVGSSKPWHSGKAREVFGKTLMNAWVLCAIVIILIDLFV
jgi:hypothetical protein